MSTPSPPMPAAGPVPGWSLFLAGDDDEGPPARSGARARRRAAEGKDRSGERFGDWELMRRLGGGGMGEVYEAFYQPNRQRYALKILAWRHHADPSMTSASSTSTGR